MYCKDNDIRAKSIRNYKSLLSKKMETAIQKGKHQWKDLELALGVQNMERKSVRVRIIRRKH